MSPTNHHLDSAILRARGLASAPILPLNDTKRNKCDDRKFVKLTHLKVLVLIKPFVFHKSYNAFVVKSLKRNAKPKEM